MSKPFDSETLQDSINGRFLEAGEVKLSWGEWVGVPYFYPWSCPLIIKGNFDTLTVLVVAEWNAKDRRYKEPGDVTKNATWRIPDGETLEGFDGVLVVYGYATDGGEVAPQSKGMKRKGSYRRIDYVENVVPSALITCYQEIRWTANDHNLKLFLDGKPLEIEDDYHSNKRNKRKRKNNGYAKNHGKPRRA